MTDKERSDWEINSLRESIHLDWTTLASKDLTADQRKAFRQHLEICVSSLKDLVERNRFASQNIKLGNHQRPSATNTK